MIIFKKAADLSHHIASQACLSTDIGFVPTMGALHGGHESLIRLARKKSKIVVCSIFINPTQFNDPGDFEKYPVTLDADIIMLIEAGCDILLLPSVQEMYPQGTTQTQAFDFGHLDTILEGTHRPGHFKGVGQIVARLLDIVNPGTLYLGQKDYQQCLIIRRLLEITGRAGRTAIVIAPTLREPDGLAMSSRNMRLTIPQRVIAAVVYQCLVSIQSKQHADSFARVRKECMDLLQNKGLEPEYIALADADDLTLLEEYDPGRKMIALLAVRNGSVRLIDNMLLNE